jgi:hypothetical protein
MFNCNFYYRFCNYYLLTLIIIIYFYLFKSIGKLNILYLLIYYFFILFFLFFILNKTTLKYRIIPIYQSIIGLFFCASILIFLPIFNALYNNMAPNNDDYTIRNFFMTSSLITISLHMSLQLF